MLAFSKGLKCTVILEDLKDCHIKNQEIVECDAKQNLNLVDLTGAGIVAAGYLWFDK